MYDSWTISTAYMLYTRLQNHTNMMVGKHGIQTFEVVVVVWLHLWLLFDVFCPSLIVFGHVVCPNILKCQFTYSVTNIRKSLLSAPPHFVIYILLLSFFLSFLWYVFLPL